MAPEERLLFQQHQRRDKTNKIPKYMQAEDQHITSWALSHYFLLVALQLMWAFQPRGPPMCRVLQHTVEETHRGSLTRAGPVLHCIPESKIQKAKSPHCTIDPWTSSSSVRVDGKHTTTYFVDKQAAHSQATFGQAIFMIRVVSQLSVVFDE